MGLGVHNHLEFFKVIQKGQLRQVMLNVAKMLHTKACDLHLHAGKIPTIGVMHIAPILLKYVHRRMCVFEVTY